MDKILKVTVAPTLIGWVASWIAPFTGTLFAFTKWESAIAGTVTPICAVLVLVLVGLTWIKPDGKIRSWAIHATWCFAIGALGCLALRLVVGILKEMEWVVAVRDSIWPVFFGITMILMVTTVTFWAVYVFRRQS